MTIRTRSRLLLCFALVLPLLCVNSACADVVEFANGAKVEGKVVARDDDSITVKTTVDGRELTRRWTLDQIQAMTIDGKREVLGAEVATAPAAVAATGEQQSEAEVEALIAELGRSQPEWWDSAELTYPKTLDLNWPDPPFQQWDNQRYIGHYVWDVVSPNPNKWQGGIRMVHHLMMTHKDNPRLRTRAMNELGRMYFDYLQDYARAAFWWKAAGVEKGDAEGHGVALAECYWRLGSKAMAMRLLDQLQPQFSMIKLWTQMGELDRALAMADANAKGNWADIANIYAGDSCRAAGDHQRAIEYYEKVLGVPASGRAARRILANQERAKASIEAVRVFDMLDLKRIPDGVYRAASLGFKGPVTVEVSVQGGRIVSVRVVQHQEKQYYTAMTATPRQIVEKQGIQGVDATSGATITSQAIIFATAKALAGGMK